MNRDRTRWWRWLWLRLRERLRLRSSTMQYNENKIRFSREVLQISTKWKNYCSVLYALDFIISTLSVLSRGGLGEDSSQIFTSERIFHRCISLLRNYFKKWVSKQRWISWSICLTGKSFRGIRSRSTHNIPIFQNLPTPIIHRRHYYNKQKREWLNERLLLYETVSKAQIRLIFS